MFRSKRPKSIYEVLRDGGELPSVEGDVRWADGAQDGVLTHHWAGSAEEGELERVLAASVEAAVAETIFAPGCRVVPLVDELLTRLTRSDIDQELLYQLGYRLATQSTDREAVKLGIAILGLYDAAHHRDELMLLGGNDEFTLFAMVALGNESDQFELAQQVCGWGRIHLVERLARTTNPQIKAWILREGFRNDVMNAYLVGIAADIGDLSGALENDPDEALLDAAGEILECLRATDGPIHHDYPDLTRATELYERHRPTS